MKRLSLLIALLSLGLMATSVSAQDASTLETNKTLVRRLFEEVVIGGGTDTSTILAPEFVQHGAGHEALVGGDAAPTVEIADLIAQDDLVGVRLRVNGQPALYLYRVENGLIAEGWGVEQPDVMMLGEPPAEGTLPALPEGAQLPPGFPTPGGDMLMPPAGFDPSQLPVAPTDAPVLEPTPAASADELEANRALVTRFYTEAFGAGNLAVLDELVAEDYIQHNPFAGQGREGLRQFLSSGFATGQPVEIAHIIAEGDKVFVRLGDAESTTVMDIFRIEDGLLQEHWDTVALPMLPQGAVPATPAT